MEERKNKVKIDQAASCNNKQGVPHEESDIWAKAGGARGA